MTINSTIDCSQQEETRSRPGEPDPEAGLATAEYAIATIAAAGFAGLLIAILKSGEVRELLLSIVRSALSLG
ncbi:DUF4244 domain-containing protein [Antribacter gilvus]|uniref:DUF4244 domain-containing protein n=1 Tax=Antribacter gilvus TaxID=2304675 RepID=UPI000F7A5CDC|nr:DUF4244 domain-containing protein [Antribacter gilvus]